jgi:transcription antitermination protein NusB
MPRHRARRLAMQALCSMDVRGERAIDTSLGFIRDSEELPEVLQLAEQMFLAAWEARYASDKLVEQHSRHWDVKRMPLVDRAILRLAVWEMTSGHVEPPIAVSEAVRVAQEFSTAESPRFINGVLEALARELPSQEEEK